MQAEKVSDTPLEFIVEYLAKAMKIARDHPGVPEDLRSNLQKALNIASGLDSYLEMTSSPESQPLAELYRKTIEHDWKKAFEEGKTSFRLPKECITGHVEGQVLKMLVRVSGARRVLEIGMFTGYGALSMAEGLPEDGRLVACEMEPYLKEFAQPVFDSSPHGRKITVKTGPAMRSLKGDECRDEVFHGVQGKSVLDRLRLDGRVAYVTGAGQGIGRAFAHALGEAGAKVAVVDLDDRKAERVAQELALKGIQSTAVTADISKPQSVQGMVDAIVAKWGTIHIGCNNAGINMNSASEDTSLDEWDQTFGVNLRGTFICCQAAGRIMLNQGYGKIINTASMAGLIVPHPQKQLAYNASKAGVVKLTQTLGTEWIDRGVRVNCISPGIVDTPLIHSEELGPLVQRWLSDIPAGRLAQVTDLQAAVVYLASDASDYMTGHNLVIEGGQSLW
ncbi:uncharacterized protein LOC108923381 isoform X2 [Scleropages formosus]|uniref:uncharacterized protein LOC108923381 isoform X2 n=1 Tax=Scleropages formosus TaxID=113540 RepID=UPI0010FA9544|nr:uncharacterized protein LOC108923381 isoform X2 [Scleropages formosus]